MIIKNPKRSSDILEKLIYIWEEAVRSTHHFLTNDDIINLKPLVVLELKQIENLLVYFEDKSPAGFIGIQNEKIEMLFVSPKYHKKGIGKSLMFTALNEYGVKYVDVNENNLVAKEFYSYIGFEVFERSELDEQGNPFPILKMKLKSII